MMKTQTSENSHRVCYYVSLVVPSLLVRKVFRNKDKTTYIERKLLFESINCGLRRLGNMEIGLPCPDNSSRHTIVSIGNYTYGEPVGFIVIEYQRDDCCRIWTEDEYGCKYGCIYEVTSIGIRKVVSHD